MKALALQIIARMPEGIKTPFLLSEMAINGKRPGDAELEAIVQELIAGGYITESREEFSRDRLLTITAAGRKQASKF